GAPAVSARLLSGAGTRCRRPHRPPPDPSAELDAARNRAAIPALRFATIPRPVQDGRPPCGLPGAVPAADPATAGAGFLADHRRPAGRHPRADVFYGGP